MLALRTRPFDPPQPEAAQAGAADEIDLATLQRCQRGERAALEQFVRCYQHRVFALLSRALGDRLSVEDLAQDVFIRAYRALATFDPHGQARLSTWLLTIAYRVLVDARRRRRSNERRVMHSGQQTPENPEQRLCSRELGAALANAVSELSPEQRDVFILAEFHELSIAEISNVTGTRQATVKTRLFRARNQLRIRLATLWEANQ